MNRENNTINSSAAECLTYAALTHSSEAGIEMRYEDAGGCK